MVPFVRVPLTLVTRVQISVAHGRRVRGGRFEPEERLSLKRIAVGLALEKSSSVTKIAVPKEIGKRLELLEKVLEEHFEKNHSVPEKIDSRPEPYDTMIKYASKAETDKNVKRSFLQRIFG